VVKAAEAANAAPEARARTRRGRQLTRRSATGAEVVEADSPIPSKGLAPSHRGLVRSGS
jgi:hypothetical protein